MDLGQIARHLLGIPEELRDEKIKAIEKIDERLGIAEQRLRSYEEREARVRAVQGRRDVIARNEE